MSHNRKEPLWKELWRPLAAFVYLGICILDFGVMPLIYEMMNQSLTNQTLVDLALKFNSAAAQIEVLHTLRQARIWIPLTLQGNGMFHIAFGAILGVSAWTRGQEKNMMGMNAYGQQGQYGMPGSFGAFPSQQYGSPYGSSYGNFNNNNYGNHPNGQQPYPSTSGGQFAPAQQPANMNAVNAGPKLDIVNPDDTNE